MRPLSFRKIIFFILLNIGYHCFAQYNYISEQRPFNLGFAMGINIADIKVATQGLKYSNANVNHITVRSTPGINLGIITNFKLNYNFAFRCIPSISLQQRNFELVISDSIDARRLEASYADIPLLLQFKSNQYKHERVYVATGLKLSYNLVSDKKVKENPKLIKIEKWDYSWVVSFGFNIIGDLIKVSPEISYSLGLGNIFVSSNSDASKYIKSIYSQSILISLLFE